MEFFKPVAGVCLRWKAFACDGGRLPVMAGVPCPSAAFPRRSVAVNNIIYLFLYIYIFLFLFLSI